MTTAHHPARHLYELAATLDEIVDVLLPAIRAASNGSDRQALCDRLLERTLHQLHDASAGLRAHAAARHHDDAA